MTISSYIQLVLQQAHYKILEDKTFFGEIPGFRGIWANEKTLEKCREILQEVLEEWLILQFRDGHALPRVNGRGLKIPRHHHTVRA